VSDRVTLVCKFGFVTDLNTNLYDLIMSWIHSFFLSRVSHRDEIYLERSLMRQHCTKQLIYHILACLLCVDL
jgi:hypothetical protein